jgi:hypothetical protein
LCFAQGYKPAEVLQRLVHDRGTLHGTVNYAPAKLAASPYERAILTWLLSRPKDVVWTGTSRIDYTADPNNPLSSYNPGFEESLVLARDARLGRELVRARVQDTSVPFPDQPEKRIEHSAYAGRLLGYPVSEIYEYLMYDIRVPGATRPHVRQVLEKNSHYVKAIIGSEDAKFEIGERRLPPLDGVDELLDMQLDG